MKMRNFTFSFFRRNKSICDAMEEIKISNVTPIIKYTPVLISLNCHSSIPMKKRKIMEAAITYGRLIFDRMDSFLKMVVGLISFNR